MEEKEVTEDEEAQSALFEWVEVGTHADWASLDTQLMSFFFNDCVKSLSSVQDDPSPCCVAGKCNANTSPQEASCVSLMEMELEVTTLAQQQQSQSVRARMSPTKKMSHNTIQQQLCES